MATFEFIIVESKGPVGVITLNRPKMLNALSFGVFREIAAAVDDLEADDKIGCILITGSEKAFAAGADIKEMQPKGFIDMFNSDFTAIGGDRVARCRKPTIAAVAGYALGGGCELAMMCDIILAADNAKFGQPEITLGTIPGIGGTQRLTRAIGKSKAMDLCLTGRMMDAAEAERSGLVSRIIPADKLMEEALAAAEKIASMSRPAAAMAKEAVNRAFETPLSEGMNVERNLFHSTFALEDRSEGMAAFIEKRKPVNKNRYLLRLLCNAAVTSAR
ncbi:MAG: enoyl-CoA hydratase [Bradyrhizobium sp.]|uniref:enoyl-CoA hydratase n=2 Tax=Nitrobacteraceae TaxID=41294 RepID=UPI00391CF97F